jgi:benzoylformate decarboxylase
MTLMTHGMRAVANGMFNMRNALMAGILLLVINGQQDSRFLIHNPVLGAPSTRLAETATEYAYGVGSVDDLAVAMQRCYLQARLQPIGPVFLSIPMNFMLERTTHSRRVAAATCWCGTTKAEPCRVRVV